MKVKIEILNDGDKYSESEFYFVTEDELDSQVHTLILNAKAKIVTDGIFEYNKRATPEGLNPFNMVKGYPGNPRTICVTDDNDFESYVRHLLSIKVSAKTHTMNENE